MAFEHNGYTGWRADRDRLISPTEVLMLGLFGMAAARVWRGGRGSYVADPRARSMRSIMGSSACAGINYRRVDDRIGVRVLVHARPGGLLDGGRGVDS